MVLIGFELDTSSLIENLRETLPFKGSEDIDALLKTPGLGDSRCGIGTANGYEQNAIALYLSNLSEMLVCQHCATLVVLA